MPKSFKRKSFDWWLSRNRGFFPYPPVIVENRKKYFHIRFRGITSSILCSIHKYGYSLSVSNEDEVWDFLDFGEVTERRTPSGRYFCYQCKPECRKFYPTRYALWEDHVFNRLLNWAKQNLLKTKWLCLFDHDGATTALVVDEKYLPMAMKDDSFYKAIPMVEHQVMPMHESDTIENKRDDKALLNVFAFKNS